MTDHPTPAKQLTDTPDLCPVCRVHGMQPCVDPDTGVVTVDHDGRPVTYANTQG